MHKLLLVTSLLLVIVFFFVLETTRAEVTPKAKEGIVGFIFDGGSIVYTYCDAETLEPIEVKLAHSSGVGDPFSGEPEFDSSNIEVRSKPIFELTENGDRLNMKRLSGADLQAWANRRILQLINAESSRTEQSFLALALYLPASSEPVEVWGSKAVRHLKNGNWIRVLGTDKVQRDAPGQGKE